MDDKPVAADAELPPECRATLTTREGVVMSVRPVCSADEPILEALFKRVSPADLRFRFHSSMRQVDHARIMSMVEVDYDRTITFIAFDGAGEAIATAMLVADTDRRAAEVAISVRSDMRRRGVGWTLLQHVLRYGQARGFCEVRSLESREATDTIALERDAGFRFEICEGNAADVIAIKHLIDPPA